LSQDGKTLVTHGPPLPAPTLGAAKQPAEPETDAARTAQVWQVAGGKELFKARVTGMGGRVVAAAFSGDGELLAVSAGDGPVDLYEVKTGKRLQTLLGRKGQGTRVAVSPDGKTVASVGADYRIQFWQADGKPLGINDPPSGILVAPITELTFVDNERAIAWLTAAQFAVAWEAPSGKLLSPEVDHAAAIHSIALPAGDKDPLTSGIDGRVFGWDLASGRLNQMVALQPARLPGQPLIRPVVTLSADATRAFWPRASNTEVFDLTSGDNLFVIPPPSSPQAPVTVNSSADGMKLITLSRQVEDKRSGSCAVWDLTTQRRVAEFDILASANALAPSGVLSPDGSRLVVATVHSGDNKQMLLFAGYDLKTGKKLAEVEDPTATGKVTMAAADDTWLVIASTSGRLWAVDYVTGEIGADIDNLAVKGESPFTGPVVFSPDGKRFAIGVVGEQFTTYGVRVYDWGQKKVLGTFIGHLGPVTALRFSPDGTVLASGAQDTSILLWDLSKLGDGK